MDLIEQLSQQSPKLSKTEQELLNYTTQSLHLVKNMSIRQFASANFVSTTTVLRFIRKVGFAGWPEFRQAVITSERETRSIEIPSIVEKDDYRDSYLKNIIEAVKVITDEKAQIFDRIMDRYPHIYILGCGLSRETALYVYHLFSTLGYDCDRIVEEYELNSIMKRIKKEDVLLVLSYSGDNVDIIHQIEKIFSVATPAIISITRSDNNVVQNMSDLNFYVFADQITYNGEDITSHCGMIAILEVLLYKRMVEGKH